MARSHDSTSPRRVFAEHDPALRATVQRVTPLRYASPAPRSLDRPPHVRAGSGIEWVGDRLLVVQDDANFVALVDPHHGTVEALPLPAGTGGRRQFGDALGNKAHKLDLEAVVSIPRGHDGALILAFGSGSTSRRETVVALERLDAPRESGGAVVRLHELPAFYATLRDTIIFSGSELNVEAVVHLGDGEGARLRLFNRGNGAPRDGIMPVSATADVQWPAFAACLARGDEAAAPALLDVVQYELGEVDGCPLTFTDAAPVAAASDATIVYTAAAEASPDTFRDGPVSGSAIGVIDGSTGETLARWTLLHDERGAPFLAKVEGIVLHRTEPMRAYVVVDRDDPDVPSELCEVELEGPWFIAR